MGGRKGGLARRAGYISDARGQADLTLVLDAGDFAAGPNASGERNTRCVVDGLRMMGYDAVGLGERDLFHGRDFLEHAAENLGKPFLSANILDAAGGKPLGDTLRIFETGGTRLGPWRRGGLKIAVTAVTRDDFSSELVTRNGQTIHASSPEETARRIVSGIRPRVDAVIVIAHLGHDRAADLAQSVPGIDLVIAGHGSPPIPFPDTTKTLLVQPAELGRSVGDLTFEVVKGERIRLVDARQQELDLDLPEDRETAGLVQRCLAEGARPGASHDGDGPPATGGSVEAGAGTGVDEPAPAKTAPAAYAGADACRSCHAAIHASWSRTPHAHAFDILVSQGKSEDPACTRCHTTGFGLGNGFRSLRWTPDMVHVQCEACHGPASRHVTRLSAPGAPQTRLPGELAPGSGSHVCIRCHNRDQDPDFDYDAELERGSHP